MPRTVETESAVNGEWQVAGNPYKERTYRNLVLPGNLVSFRQVVKETDLLVHAARPLEDVTRESILHYRGHIEAYIKAHPGFARTLKPWRVDGPAPTVVREMASAGEKAGVGPMAAVAGVIAEHVGRELLRYCGEVIVENGGDVFLKTDTTVSMGIFAGKSPLSLRIGLQLDPSGRPISVCTSSGTVGHSLSLGKADAVCVLSSSCALADAAATSIGNRVGSKKDIPDAMEYGKSIKGVDGLVVIAGSEIGMWGELEIIPLSGKKG
jgi:ApbE superfamily uncharacterized protein (UPF0280 family)